MDKSLFSKLHFSTWRFIQVIIKCYYAYVICIAKLEWGKQFVVTVEQTQIGVCRRAGVLLTFFVLLCATPLAFLKKFLTICTEVLSARFFRKYTGSNCLCFAIRTILEDFWLNIDKYTSLLNSFYMSQGIC